MKRISGLFSNISFRNCPLWLFWVVVCIFYSLIFINVDFAEDSAHSFRGFITLMVQWGVVAVAQAALFALICSSRWLFAFTFPLILTASAILSYFKLTMGITISVATVELMAVNDFKVWFTLISPLLIVIAIAALALGIAFAVYRWKCVRSPRQWFIFPLLGIIILLLPPMVSNRWYFSMVLRMPFCFYFTTQSYIVNHQTALTERHAFDNVPVSAGTADLPDVVVIVGESLRADHLGLNGYHRPTTPRLSADTAVISLPHVTTPYIYTHQSVPYMLTRADSIHPDRALNEPSFITLFNRAGYNSYWLSAQDKNPAYAPFINEADSLNILNAGISAKDLYDHIMLPAARQFLTCDNGGKPRLLVIHAIGSHWVYNYPQKFARYKPEADTKIFSELTTDQIVNSYDNSVLATDDFIATLTDLLRNRNAIVFYLSDHGENLGENGKVTHNDPTPQTKNPACLIWYSEEYARLNPDKIAALRRKAPAYHPNEFLFHTILDAATLTTPLLQPQKSLTR